MVIKSTHLFSILTAYTDRMSWKEAGCDDIFVYGGSLSFPSKGSTRTVELAKPSVVNEEDSIPYEDWIVRLDAMEYYPLGANSAGGRLNGKAHELSNAF